MLKSNGDVRTYYLDADLLDQVRGQAHRAGRGTRVRRTSWKYYKEVNGVFFPFSYASGPKGSSSAAKAQTPDLSSVRRPPVRPSPSPELERPPPSERSEGRLSQRRRRPEAKPGAMKAQGSPAAAKPPAAAPLAAEAKPEQAPPRGSFSNTMPPWRQDIVASADRRAGGHATTAASRFTWDWPAAASGNP